MPEFETSPSGLSGDIVQETIISAERIRAAEYERTGRELLIANAISDLAFSYRVLHADVASKTFEFLPDELPARTAISRDLALSAVTDEEGLRNFAILNRIMVGGGDTEVFVHGTTADNMSLQNYEYGNDWDSSHATPVRRLGKYSATILSYRSKTLYDYLHLTDRKRRAIRKYDQRNPE